MAAWKMNRKTVISASRRTDIPAFYLKWFMEQIRRGKVEVRNPFYRRQVKVVDLSPRTVEWIVFWSRNYNVFLKHRHFFQDYQLFFHFTIVSHHPALEKHQNPVPVALRQLERLAFLYGGRRITWRYDPLVFWVENGCGHTNYRSEEFRELCRQVAQLGVSRCYLSFVTPYTKFIRRFRKKYPRARLVNLEDPERFKILQEMLAIAREYGIRLYSCCNDRLLQLPGMAKGRCIDGQLLNQLSSRGKVTEAKAPTRKDCGCTSSIDVGDYQLQPCYLGCLYCYANPRWK